MVIPIRFRRIFRKLLYKGNKDQGGGPGRSETRALLPEAAKKNYVYHIPADEKDACGVRRKCERNMARFGAELPNVSLLEAYPSQILL